MSLDILTGALPELGTVGVALEVLYVFRNQMQSATADLRSQMEADRAFFSEERARIRAEAARDIELTREQAGLQRRELLDELKDAKAELQATERQVDSLRAQMFPSPTTVSPPPSRHRAPGGS